MEAGIAICVRRRLEVWSFLYLFGPDKLFGTVVGNRKEAPGCVEVYS